MRLDLPPGPPYRESTASFWFQMVMIAIFAIGVIATSTATLVVLGIAI